VRGRSASQEIVAEASRRDVEIVVMGSPRKRLTQRRGVFGATVDRVMRNAPCRVLVTAAREEAAA
jgi:nucleotide-binding universal stress UspA family protein